LRNSVGSSVLFRFGSIGLVLFGFSRAILNESEWHGVSKNLDLYPLCVDKNYCGWSAEGERKEVEKNRCRWLQNHIHHSLASLRSQWRV